MKSLLKVAAIGVAAMGLAGTANAAETLNITSVKTLHSSPAYSATLKVDKPGSSNDIQTSGLLSPQLINGSLKAFCVDLAQTAGTGTFTVKTLAEFLGSSSSAQYKALTALVSNYGTTSNSVLLDAAVQLAVWEVLYEKAGNAFDVTKNQFSSSNWSDSTTSGPWWNQTTNSEVRNQANTLLASLGDLTDTGEWDFYVATNSKKQDLLYFVQRSPVPEPATWGMMILGLGLVGASMRRRVSCTSVSFA